ncbi:DUF302 domain-containing protein [Allochromatium vinosum]|uniref:DUF302 domain-containing protein n=1 Tax=Allochromatium vinosum (strain ATCC 17899 / DSM 180 / NBRC 103801 / NCIMB 10441 / D) TaxID=572477 RepID=D3RTT9_ALLVD|nr:DUF302 domain-containing protein [Allochromatium vinosum]ADC62598.1 protein of unknown function DUF302 [Allochromatium vinosum DSM 180]
MRKIHWLAVLTALPLLFATLAPRAEGMNIADTVVKMPLAEDVSIDDAIDSMLLRANGLNFKLVARQPLYKELEAMGVETRHVEIFQFCDARIAARMLAENLDFAAYLPCRITLIEDQDGKVWLVTLDLDRVMQMADLPPNLKELAIKVRDTMNEIMTAGANGDL